MAVSGRGGSQVASTWGRVASQNKIISHHTFCSQGGRETHLSSKRARLALDHRSAPLKLLRSVWFANMSELFPRPAGPRMMTEHTIDDLTRWGYYNALAPLGTVELAPLRLHGTGTPIMPACWIVGDRRMDKAGDCLSAPCLSGWEWSSPSDFLCHFSSFDNSAGFSQPLRQV